MTTSPEAEDTPLVSGAYRRKFPLFKTFRRSGWWSQPCWGIGDRKRNRTMIKEKASIPSRTIRRDLSRCADAVPRNGIRFDSLSGSICLAHRGSPWIFIFWSANNVGWKAGRREIRRVTILAALYVQVCRCLESIRSCRSAPPTAGTPLRGALPKVHLVLPITDGNVVRCMSCCPVERQHNSLRRFYPFQVPFASLRPHLLKNGFTLRVVLCWRNLV